MWLYATLALLPRPVTMEWWDFFGILGGGDDFLGVWGGVGGCGWDWFEKNCKNLNIYNARSLPMSPLFLTMLPPTLLCAHLLVLIFLSTAR